MSNFFRKKEGIIIGFFLTCIAVFITMRFFVPLFLPFILAIIFVLCIYPQLCFLKKTTKIGKGFWAGAILCIVLLLAGTLLWYVGGKAFHNIGDFLSNIEQTEDMVYLFIRNCCNKMEAKLGIGSQEMETFILEKVNIFIENMQMEIAPRVMGESFSYAKNIFAILASFVVTFIAVILFAKDYEKINGWVLEQKGIEQVKDIVQKIAKLCKVFVKAQIVILFLISTLCSLGFLILKINNPLGLGLLTGILELLPFIGTGIILIPLAIFAVLNGNIWNAVGFLILYILCALLREFLEPKLIGKKMGILPIGILAAVYIGIKIYGLLGIVTGPVSVLLIFEIMKKIKNLAILEKE